MDYTSIHIYGHLLSDDILNSLERDFTLSGNREIDFGIDTTVSHSIDYVWSSLRTDWNYFKERNIANDVYGTRRSRDFMERFLANIGYKVTRQSAFVNANGNAYDITYLCEDLADLPIIVVGDKTGEVAIDTLDKSSLDYRAKGERRRKSPHATMLEYLNASDCVYGIVANGRTVRLIRNTGQLVKLTYIEFDIQRMLEEDKYAEFCLMFRLLHASRFRTSGDEQCVMERYFNMSIESGNRIRAGLSDAVKRTMEVIGNAAVRGNGEGNNVLRDAIASGEISAENLNKELIHFIYRLLFLFIIEDRNLVYQIPDDNEHPDYTRLCNLQGIYTKYYAASRLRSLSEKSYLKNRQYDDIWQGLMETFRLFESGSFGEKLGIKPLGGILFNEDTLHYLKDCSIDNEQLLIAFSALNEFVDERNNVVKINYSSLDVEEFGSVYEGILEMRPFVNKSTDTADWSFGFVGGLDRKSTSSYYTRPDLVQNLIRTTLEPVIKERIKRLSTPEEKVQSLLSMKVCDAASGSGHIVLAMARTIAWYVCTIRTGEDNPASLDYREALREVIQKCIYAVDYNPDAVELCKVVLWIEGYCAGKPLSFLDHHIRCGNSVVGVTNLDMLLDGVPKDAFCAEDKETLKNIRDLNKQALSDIRLLRDGSQTGLQIHLFNGDFQISSINQEQVGLANKVNEISAMPENSLLEEIAKKRCWEELMDSPRVECLRRACDIYTYAFYHRFSEKDLLYHTDDNGNEYMNPIPYSRTVYQALEEIKAIEGNTSSKFTPLSDDFKQEVEDIAFQHHFFHWCVEFPEVFTNGGGFDVMCGNPPWDELQMEDRAWFLGKNDLIANLSKQDLRKKAIAKLKESDPLLYNAYTNACSYISSQVSFIRHSKRFNLTAKGKIELASLFAELCLSFSRESWGLVLPTSIAVNDTNKDFFSKLIDENRLVSLYDFENKERLFKSVASSKKFCLLTVGSAQNNPREVTGGFCLTRIDHLLDTRRIYKVNTANFAKFNPNTKLCTIFRSSKDIELTAKIYNNSMVIINEHTGENPWGVQFGSMFNMANSSHLFHTYTHMIDAGAVLKGNVFDLNGEIYLPLYEGKMIWLYDHHFGSFPIEGERPARTTPLLSEEYSNPNHRTMPWYWVQECEIDKLLENKTKSKKNNWFVCFRDISKPGNQRTMVSTIVPRVGLNNKAPFIIGNHNALEMCLFNSMLSSIVLDYVAKQKIGGNSMNFFYIMQFPVLTLEQISKDFQTQIILRASQLHYFNHDLDGWAEELWNEMTEEQRSQLPQIGNKQPFTYDEERRAVLQAELDAIFAHLYGLNTEDLRYILDPEDVCGEGCINETFCVLKNNEIRRFGEYRTKRLVLEAWNKFGFDR